MTEYQIQSKHANLLGDLGQIKNNLEKFYNDSRQEINGKTLLSLIDGDDYLDDIWEILRKAKRIEATVKESVK